MKEINPENPIDIYPEIVVHNFRQVSLIELNHAVHVMSSYEGEDIVKLSERAVILLKELKKGDNNE